MSQAIEQVYKEVGLSLFPEKLCDLETDCSCPDWSNPCKHVAAVYYLLGEEFDRDPFLIFKLRGAEREEFVARLGAVQAPVDVEVEAAPEAEPEPLAADTSAFWGADPLADDVLGEIRTPPVSAALPRRLG